MRTGFNYYRVAVVGNVDAGKSTLLGVLTHGELDNGRGHARMKLFRHKHEMESGRYFKLYFQCQLWRNVICQLFKIFVLH